MAKQEITVGATDQTIDVFILDSSSTTGEGLDGLAYNTSGLTCYYRKGATGSATALSLATQTVGGAHSDGGFVEIDATNMTGQYRLDLSDAMVDTVGMLKIYLKGAADMAPTLVEIQVVAAKVAATIGAGDIATDAITAAAVKADAVTKIQDGLATSTAQGTAQADLDIITGTDGVTLATTQGLYAPAKAGDQMALVNDAITASKFDESTAFPLASADSGATAVARTGADGDTLETLSDQVDGVYTGTPPSAADIRSEIDSNSTQLAAIVADTNELQTNQGNWLTATGFSTHSAADVWSAVTRTLTAATNITSDGSAITMSSSGVVGTVNLVNTTTTNTDMRGTDSAYTGTPPSASAISTQVASDLQTAHGSGAWTTATSVAVSDKTGFKLASDGLDSVSTTAPSGPASNFREMVVQTWRWIFKKRTKDGDEIKTYADDDSTVVTTQSYTSSGDDEEVGSAT